MKGLEAVELNLSELENEFTIGSEYYKREFVQIVDELKEANLKKEDLKNCTTLITDGDHGSTQYKDSGILYLLSESINEGYIDLKGNGIRYISKELHNELRRSLLKPGDVVVTKTGVYYGKSAVIPKEIDEANTSAHVAKISIDKTKLNPYFLSTFLNSKFGYSQLRRRGIKVSRPEIKLIEFQDIKVAIPSLSFQKKIEEIVLLGQEVLAKSNQAYNNAELSLLEEIGLDNHECRVDSVNIKTFKDSFLTSGRLDAEYYLPKYEYIEQKIKSYKAYDTLGNLLIKIDTGEYSPEYFRKNEIDGLTFYIRSTNIKGGQITFDDNFYVKKKDFVRKAKEGNIVTARVGSVGIFGEVRKELEGSVYSDNVLCFQLPENFISSVYTLLFNTNFYFELIDRLARGSVQQRLNQETLKDLVLPIIEYNIQEKLATLIEESFSLKKQSSILLEIAKQAVEIAIEKDEMTALDFIKKHTEI